MARSFRSRKSLLWSLLLLLVLTLQLPTPCQADGIIIPAYFYPGTGGPGGVGNGWAAMATAAAQVPVVAIFNPNSGPAPGPADPNYVTAMTNLESAGGKAVAYVYTGFGTTSLATVESQISTYITQYGSSIDGFFIDGMLVDPSTQSYYQSLDSYIKGRSASDLVIGNPGQPFLNGVTPANYLSTADIFSIFEGSDTAFSIYPSGQTWYQSYPSSRFSNFIYDVSGSSQMPADLIRAESLNAGYVYVTDQNLPNPYDELPSYWNQEVSALATPAAVPEPDSLSLLVLSGLVAIPLRAAKSTRRFRPTGGRSRRQARNDLAAPFLFSYLGGSAPRPLSSGL